MYPKFVHYKYYKKWIISEIHAHCKAILQSVEIVKNKTNAAHWSICSVVSCQNIFSFLWEMCRISKPIFQYITVCSLCVWGALNPTVLFSFPFWLFPSNPLCNSFFFFFKLVMTCFPTCSACPHLLFFSPRMYISTRWILPWMQIFQIFDYSSHRTLDLVPSPVCSQNTPIVCCQMWLMLPLKKCRMSPAAYFMSSRFMYRLLT